ncbi:MAG: 1-acyl-sn-glycerol-3-phosphate acyltransferase [Proteobacteria bacterium]|nr:1-acyl-sn-glycerol-3-phosphate acyltransferase [Burkholderiales bacterium]
MSALRSLVFALVATLITPPYALLAIAIFFLSPMTRYRIVSTWSVTIAWLARVVCGVHWRVSGLERLPTRPAIILAKHQSAWETLAFQAIFPPQVWVLRRSLLWVPFVGWGIAMLSPIAIERSKRIRALKQTLEQGRARLAQGFWVVIFPEGSRVDPGTRGTWQVGGAWLATHTGAPVVPVAVNSGELWPRNGFVKHPGTIDVVILDPIDPTGMKPEALIRLVEQRVEDAMLQLNGKARTR